MARRRPASSDSADDDIDVASVPEIVGSAEARLSAPPRTVPRSIMDVEEYRIAVLRAAGITEERARNLVLKTFQRLEEALDAETADGKPSHHFRLQAIEKVQSLLGMLGGGAPKPAAPDPVNVQVNVAGYAKPK